MDPKRNGRELNNLIFLCDEHYDRFVRSGRHQFKEIRAFRDYLYTAFPQDSPIPNGEILYEATESHSLIISDIDAKIKRYLSQHPEQLYNLTPRRFEEVIASILEDMGLEVRLTQTTRDGGVDIYGYVKNQVCSFLLLVECKKYSLENPVGVEVVQRLFGIQNAQRANKSMIVTTSRFSSPAVEECSQYGGLMELKDYEDLKSWLSRYITA